MASVDNATSQKRILIVDDDKIVGKLVKGQLEEFGYTVSLVLDPVEAIPIVNSFTPHLILLDVVMPNISGYELLEAIRQLHSPVELPVIMMTAKSEDEEIIKALELGANDYLVKPFNIKIAVARIDVQLRALEAAAKQSELRELHTVNAMIATYNHELNNPLAIALGYLNRDPDKIKPEHLVKVREALDRMPTILKKISKLAEGGVSHVEYVEDVDMIDLGD